MRVQVGTNPSRKRRTNEEPISTADRHRRCHRHRCRGFRREPSSESAVLRGESAATFPTTLRLSPLGRSLRRTECDPRHRRRHPRCRREPPDPSRAGGCAGTECHRRIGGEGSPDRALLREADSGRRGRQPDWRRPIRTRPCGGHLRRDECERRHDRLRPRETVLHLLLRERIWEGALVRLFVRTPSASWELRSCVSRCVHPTASARPRLQGHPLPAFSGPPPGPSPFRRRW